MGNSHKNILVCSIGTKCWWDVNFKCPFKNCIRYSCPSHFPFFFFPFSFHRKYFLKSSFGTTCSFNTTFRNFTKWSVHQPLCNNFFQQYQFWLCNCKPCVTIWSQISWIVRKDIYETILFCTLKKVLYNHLVLLVVLRK
jgi:hypothetical protein